MQVARRAATLIPSSVAMLQRRQSRMLTRSRLATLTIPFHNPSAASCNIDLVSMLQPHRMPACQVRDCHQPLLPHSSTAPCMTRMPRPGFRRPPLKVRSAPRKAPSLRPTCRTRRRCTRPRGPMADNSRRGRGRGLGPADATICCLIQRVFLTRSTP